MDCVAAQEILSAHLDHEASTVEVELVDTHLAGCSSCRQWWDDIGRLNRTIRVRAAEPVPDLAGAVLVRSRQRRGRGEWARLALFVVAATDLVLAMPGLLLGDGAASVHDGRHLGSFGVAVSVGLLYVAWRPVRAYGILPIVAALAATMLFTAAIDIVHGRATSLGEAHHVLDAAGLVLVWLLAGRPLPRRHRPDPPGPRRHLRVVTDLGSDLHHA